MSNVTTTKHKILPKLRFPEFLNDVEWQQLLGNELFTQINNKNHDSNLPVLAITQQYGAIPRDEIDYQVSVTKKSLSSYKVVEVGDYIISLRSFQGGIEYSYFKGICSPAYIILRKKRDISEEYFKQFFKTERFIRQLQRNLEGLRDGKIVSYSQFSELRLPTPSIPEQNKIADCFTTLDDLITAENQKLERLQAHKKGLLQNLFPAEGQTIPALRFPEFQDAPEWKQRKLKNISPAVFDGTHQTPTYTTEGVPFFSVENLITGNKNKFISHDDYLIATQKNKPEKGDILLTRIGQLGYTQVVTWDYEFSVYVTLAVIKSSDSFDSYYLHSFMQSSYYQNEIRKNALLIAVPPKINMDSLRETKVLLPKLQEQRKIATCLSALDDQITCQKSQIETLQAHKKGLLQQLFPSSEEDLE